MLIQRILTAIIAIPLLVWAIQWGGQQLFFFIIIITAGFALLEFFNMAVFTSAVLRISGLAFGLCLVWFIQQYQQYLAFDGIHYQEKLTLLLMTIPTAVTFSFLLIQYAVYPRKFMLNLKPLFLLIGILYICLFLSYLILLQSDQQGKRWIFFLLLVLWCNDSGAYFTGRVFGRHQLSPLVSPKKTIEGAVGGIVLGLLAACSAKMLFLNQLSYGNAVILAISSAVLGQLGDLCESTLKRHCGVKDSGGLLPGHGGMLDRIDSLLFVAPLTYYYKSFIV